MSTFSGLFGGSKYKPQVATYASDPDVQNLSRSREAIKGIFAGMDPNRYTDIRQRNVDAAVAPLVERRADEDRLLGFNLARAGQVGGSQDVEGRKLIDRAATDRARAIEQGGMEAANALRGADTQAEIGLTGGAGGMAAAGSSINDALALLKANQDAALRYGSGQVAGQAMADLTSLYPASRIGAGRARGRTEAQRLLDAVLDPTRRNLG
jgi:hypothetical protein